MTASPSAGASLDHLVVAAASLDQGVAWCEATLGITPGPGGRHALMGTHNRLFRIATAAFPNAYFEIIATDPEAPPSGRARWFGLDDPALQAAIAVTPRLVHAVARTAAIERHRSDLLAAGSDPGATVDAGRDTPQGRLSWQILVRDDGGLDCSGALPTLIQWQGRHPAEQMAESGVALKSLVLNGVPASVKDVLRLRSVEVLPGAGPALVATLTTPRGEVVLTGGLPTGAIE